MSHGNFLKAFREFGLVVRAETAKGEHHPLFAPPPNRAALTPPPPSPPSHLLQGTFKKLYKMRTLKFGTLIGEDALGNKYYENTKVRAAAVGRARSRGLGAPPSRATLLSPRPRRAPPCRITR